MYQTKAMRLIVHCCVMLLFVATTCAAQGGPGSRTAPERRGPERGLLGAYLVNLSDFDFAADTFHADLWLWTHTSPTQHRNCIKTLEFTNSVRTASILNSTVVKDGVRWTQCKVLGTFRHNWNFRNFPFDRHTLEIRLEDSAEDASTFMYVPDTENSSFHKEMQLDDWKITKFCIDRTPVVYSSTFGDPGLKSGSSSKYAGIRLIVTIERTELASYFKLTAVAYVAFLLMLITCFIHIYNKDSVHDSLGIRINLLGGSLFSCVLNMTYSSSVLGAQDGITFVDKIHIIVLVYIVLAAVLSVSNRTLFIKGYAEDKLKRFDRWAAAISVISFIALNAALLTQAARMK